MRIQIWIDSYRSEEVDGCKWPRQGQDSVAILTVGSACQGLAIACSGRAAEAAAVQPLLQVRGLVVAAAVSAIIAGLAAARARASAGTVFIFTADEHIERGWVECVEVRWEET